MNCLEKLYYRMEKLSHAWLLICGIVTNKRKVDIGIMQSVEAGGIQFPVISQVERKNGDVVPLIKINMMSDERWKQLTEESAVKHFREWHGREPESVQEALEVQRAFIKNLECEAKGAEV